MQQAHARQYVASNSNLGRQSNIDDRKAALFDMVYLVVALNLYVTSFILPMFGVAAGLMLLVGGSHDGTKRVGNVCLTISGIAFVLWVAFAITWSAYS